MDIIERKSYKEQIIYSFLQNFVKNLDLNIPLENLNIYTSQELVYKDIFVRKETWKHDIEIKEIKLFIDCIIDNELKQNLKEKYYHVTWAALTYYTRNVDKHILLKPLNEIYNNNKTKFCDYVFLNNIFRNGVKRYEFYQILNEIKDVEQPKDDSRFSVNMFNDSVELHKPYRFSIAFENDIMDGWVTEKIINSFLAGCIPIYDGTDDVYKYFNKDSFINAKDFNSLKELAEYVVKVDNDPELYNKYIQEAPTNVNKLQQLFWWETHSVSSITLFGSCRISGVNKSNDINDINYTHSTKETIQMIKFLRGELNIHEPYNKLCFRKGILENKCVTYNTKLENLFNSSNIVIIEICSMKKYIHDDFYLHHLCVDKRKDPKYMINTPQNVLDNHSIEYQSDEEIENDINIIKKLLFPKKIIIISHYNVKLNNEYLSRRNKLINLLENICIKLNVAFINPTVVFKNYKQEQIIKPDFGHYTDFGQIEISNYINKFINTNYNL